MSKCVDPVLCYTGPNTRKFRHYSHASPFFKALHQTVFNCGKCIFCRKRKSTELAMRCVLHASMYPHNCFLTLTYDEKKEGYHNVFNYSDIQKFKKRLRSHVWRKEKQKIEIFNVHEYGKNGKKHWHLVVFGWNPSDRRPYSNNNGNPLSTSDELTKMWPYGFHTIGDVSEASAMYQAQYTQKDFQYSHAGTSRKSHSKHSGIARQYFLQHYDQILRLGFVPFNGRKAPVPRYFVKLARKHFSHFHDQSVFFDNKFRKALYRPFKDGEANLKISDAYEFYLINRKEVIKQIALEWDEFIDQDLFDSSKADFQLSGENALYDLQNKIQHKGF